MCIKKTEHAAKRAKTLLVRSAPPSLVDSAVRKLRERNRDSVITIFSSGDADKKVTVGTADRVLLSHSAGRFSLFKTGLKRAWEIRQEGFSETVMLYNNPPGRECLNLDILALALGGRVWIMDTEERFFPLLSRRWLFYILPLRFLNSILTLLLLSLISPLILPLFLLAKILNRKSLSTEELIRYGG